MRSKYWLWFAGVTNLMAQVVQPEKAYFKDDGIPKQGHKRMESSLDFSVIGAYPGGRNWDLLRGLPASVPSRS